jgi:hypothetical protein
MSFDVYTPTRQFRIVDEIVFRTYTAAQIQALLAEIEDFEVTSVHDFGYDIDRETRITSSTEDALFVLSKR